VKKFVAQTRESEFCPQTAACSHPQEKGYVLLTLLLMVALMAILTLAVIVPIKFEMQREQEQELIHRGVQYSRAIRAYYKKFSRYPTKLEDLDNTNNLRYLRKHYKDPITRQDFKLLHYGEPGVTLGSGFSIGGGSIPGANSIGSPTGMNGSGGNSSSGFGASPNSQTGSGQQGTNPASGGSSQASETSSQTGGTGQGDASSSGNGQQLVASGPIVGVASFSKKATIREFNKKKKYNEWQFVYDPTNDRGGLITTPNQPPLQGFGTQPALNGAQPAGSNGSAFGSSSGGAFGNSNGSSFGQSSSFGNNANPGGSAPPVQPPANPPQ
jgi:type II secretory pathway pseudopilin PulG